MRRRGDRHQFGDALDDAQHGDLRIAERDKPGVDAVGAGVGHRLRRPLKTRAIAGKGINRLGFYSSRRRMRLLELIDLADMLGIRPETNHCSNTIFSDPGARCTYPLEKSGLATSGLEKAEQRLSPTGTDFTTGAAAPDFWTAG